jgi:thiol-disulfide isomerase/thioredoxin
MAGIALALSASVAAGDDGLQRWTGGPTPPMRLKTLTGKELNLASFRGRTVIVNFWATWCEPCLAEMPSLQRLRDKLAQQGVEVVAVNLKENAARISPFVEKLDLTFPVVRDPDGALTRQWRVNVFPTSFIVGPDQRIAFVVRGGVEWDSARIESEVRRVNRTARPPGVHQASAR